MSVLYFFETVYAYVYAATKEWKGFWTITSGIVGGTGSSITIAVAYWNYPADAIVWIVSKQFFFSAITSSLYVLYIKRNAKIAIRKKRTVRWIIQLFHCWWPSVAYAVVIHAILPGSEDPIRAIVVNMVTTIFGVALVVIPTIYASKEEQKSALA